MGKKKQKRSSWNVHGLFIFSFLIFVLNNL